MSSDEDNYPTPFFRLFLRYLRNHFEGLIFITTTCILVPLAHDNENHTDRCMIVILGMAIFYATAAIPIFATTLVPVFAFPLLGIMSSKRAYELYFKDTFVMFSGYYAAAIEYSGLHIRASYAVLSLVGCSPRRVHFAICIVIMFFSMWITNTACASMMINVVDVILVNLNKLGLCRLWADEDMDLPVKRRRPSNMKACFYLSVAYASSIGGCGCVIGSPTNFVISSVYNQYFTTSNERDKVGNYMLYSIPIVIVCTLLMWIDLEIVFMGLFRPDSKDAEDVTFKQEDLDLGLQVINEKYNALGPMTMQEISIILLFVLLIVAYVMRNHGMEWLDKMGEDADSMNTVPEVCVMILFFVLPVNYRFLKFWAASETEGTVSSLLNWRFALQRVPWNLIFLVGSGTALAAGSKQTGVDNRMAKALSRIHNYPVYIALLILITGVVLMTNITANITTANITMPILVQTAGHMRVHPIYVIMPTGIACSMAFMLPGATPSNLLIRELGRIKRYTLLKGGILPTITSIFAIWIINSFWCGLIYPVIHDVAGIREVYVSGNFSHTEFVYDEL